MGQDFSVIAETVTTTAPGGITVGSGGSLAVKSGTLSLGTGMASLASGASLSLASGAVGAVASAASLSLAAGGIFIAPSINVGAPGTSSQSIAVASGTTIALSQGVIRVSATASTTSTTLNAGTLDGQVVVVLNESANQVIITGNTKTVVTIAASSAAQYVWVSTDTLWWHLT